MDQPLALPVARRILHESFGFDDFLPFQRTIIETILRGEDTLVVLPTGSGKSLCFQIPALLRDGITVVISPLIALMKDQIDSLLARNLPVACLNSTLSLSENKRVLDSIRAGQVKMVYVSPERLRNGFFLNALRSATGTMPLWVVDEAHCITEWGHDFRTDYLFIPDAMESVSPGAQLVMFTATATPIVRDDILRQMRRESAVRITGNFDRPNLYLGYRQTQTKADKYRTLTELVRRPGPGIIYTATRRQCEDAHRFLQELGKKSEYYHAGRSGLLRSEVHERFLNNEIEIVCATNAFGMGLDKADVRFIIHYAHPASIDAYYQEIGRGGRDGKRCDCVLLFSRFDRKVQEKFIENSTPFGKTVKECFEALLQLGGDARVAYVDRSFYEKRNVELFEMEKAGVLMRRMLTGGNVSVYLSCEAEAVLHSSTSEERAILLALQSQFDLLKNGYANGVDLDLLQHNPPGLDPFALEQILIEMDRRGLIVYRPGDRSVCYEILLSSLSASAEEQIRQSVLLRRDFKLRRLETMVGYANSETCLRRYLLETLADEADWASCGFCDNCL